jgi:hypothetical protein
MKNTANEDPAMSLRTIRRLSVVIATLLLFATPAAHAQTPPDGDNYLTPVNVKLNASKTIKDVQFATLESPAIEAVACDGNASSDHSVWFQFTLPSSAVVDLDANGSLLDTGTGTNTQLVMTLYEPDGIGLSETTCLFENKPRMINLTLSAGTHVVRLASDMVAALQAPSQYRLSVRVRYLGQLLADPEFEANALGLLWKARKTGDPPQIVRTCEVYCYVSFNGAAGGKLQQTVEFSPSRMKFKAGDYFGATTYVNGTPAEGSDVKLTVVVAYSDGTPPTKRSLVEHIVQTSTTNVSSPAGGFAVEIASKAVKSVKFMIVSPAASDTFRVVNSVLSVSAGSSVRAPLGVPPSP